MLGCQDFCGYYDWTFAYVRRRFGDSAVHRLWAEAIGGESQDHYAQAGLRAGLAGLYRTWTKTGEDEHCDWTFTLDEEKNVLRWDMRQCPSKGFLLGHDLNADEDYCDHCMGWMVPLLARVGAELVHHEHNHCGQCWGEMRMTGRPSGSLDLPIDIRKDPRWNRGYVDRWQHNVKLPLLEEASASTDPCRVIEDWFARARGSEIVTGETYAQPERCPHDPAAVLIGADGSFAPAVAERFAATERSRRPLLLYPYFPGMSPVDFVSLGLPRPVPVLPLLIRAGAYVHRPRQPVPSTDALVAMLLNAVECFRSAKS